jgi:hypothetical protein
VWIVKLRIKWVATVATAVGVLAAVPAVAHHSFAAFFNDEQGVVTVKGVVTEFSFKNPHGLIRLNVKGESGAVEEWRAETNSPTMLERRGWKKDSLKAGDEVVVDGWRARDGSRYMRMKTVKRADGSVVGTPLESISAE